MIYHMGEPPPSISPTAFLLPGVLESGLLLPSGQHREGSDDTGEQVTRRMRRWMATASTAPPHAARIRRWT